MAGCLAEKVGEYGNVSMMPIAFGGHCYYVRRCVVGEQMGDDFRARMVGGIAIPEAAYIHEGGFTTIRNLWDRTCIAEVVGIGPAVGTPCSKAHQRMYKRARWIEPVVEKGDLLMFDDVNHDIRIMLSPLADYERFVEESCPIAIYKPGV